MTPEEKDPTAAAAQDDDLQLHEETVEDLEAKPDQAEDVKGGMPPQQTWSKAYTGWCC